MLPEKFYEAADNALNENLSLVHCDKTYNLSNMTGFIDGREAVSQAVVKILNTERFMNAIYSSDYGIEIVDLIGKDCDFVCVESERRITEALTVDERITGVSDFKFDVKKSVIFISFTVHTIFGEFKANMEVVYV
jgi:hypothetical protein